MAQHAVSGADANINLNDRTQRNRRAYGRKQKPTQREDAKTYIKGFFTSDEKTIYLTEADILPLREEHDEDEEDTSNSWYQCAASIDEKVQTKIDVVGNRENWQSE